MVQPSVVCGVDFSEASRGALRHAAALAEHFYGVLTVLAVDDPLLAGAATMARGAGWLESETCQELEHFVHRAFPGRTPQVAKLVLRQAVGSAATEILSVASETGAGAIVVGTHGRSGLRKMAFGSTTERVLRDTTLPVIVTPATDPGPESVEDWRRSVKTLLVPVDFSEYSRRQLRIARGLVEATSTGMVIAHVLERLSGHFAISDMLARAYATRRATAQRELEHLAALVAPQVSPALVLAEGDAATEIARIAREHGAGAIVIGLHAAPGTPRQMGTVTYRLLCQTPTVVVALPPSLSDIRLTELTGRAEPHCAIEQLRH